MKSLKALTEHLKDLELINDNFDAWAEKGRLEYSGTHLQAGFVKSELLYRLQYTAVFSWEAWGGDAYFLFAMIVEWLRDHDYDFDEFGEPEWSADLLDDQTADVEISIRFEDAVYKVDGVITTEEPNPNLVDGVSVCGGAQRAAS